MPVEKFYIGGGPVERVSDAISGLTTAAQAATVVGTAIMAATLGARGVVAPMVEAAVSTTLGGSVTAEPVPLLPVPLTTGSSTDHVTSQALAAAPEVAGVLGSALGGPIIATGARVLCGAALGLYDAYRSRVPTELRF